MLNNTLWHLFEETGKVEIYLAYKENQTRSSTYETNDLTRTYVIPKCVNK